MIYRKGWKEVILGDYIDIKHGYAFKSKYFTLKGQYLVLTPGNFYEGGGFKLRKEKDRFTSENYPNEYLLEKDDILVAMTEQVEGLIGSPILIPESGKYLHNQRLGLVQIKSSQVSKGFIYWLMRDSGFNRFLSGMASGTSIRHTSPSSIRAYKFKLPPLKEQKAIAEILSSLDDKINLLHRQNKTLEDMAQVLFRKWFVEGADETWERIPLGYRSKLS